MQNELLLIIVAIILAFGGLAYFFNKKVSELKQEPKSDEALLEWLKTMQKTVDATNKTVNDSLRTSSASMISTLQENTKQLNERLDKAASVIGGVQKEVGQMSEIGRNMRELQNLLKSPKLRGNIGEEGLRDLISQIFPKNSFHLQYTFRSGDKVDAAIQTDAGILPIDSKFPMENFMKMTKAENDDDKKTAEKEFEKDVKKHIDAIAKKYILPDEGTMDFALMYIPSEAVYYELANNVPLMGYSRRSRIYPVSPNTLYMNLQTILLSFEGKKIEQTSKEVMKLLRALKIDYGKVDENMAVLGKHIKNADSQFSNVISGFAQLGNKINSADRLEEKTIDLIEEKL